MGTTRSPRARTRAALAVVGVILVAMVAVAVPPTAQASAERPARPAALLQASTAIPPAAPPLPVVETTANLNKLNEPVFVKGHDKGQSTLYDNGAGTKFSYWSFGDTAIKGTGQSDYQLGNTGTRLNDLNLSDNVTDLGSWVYDNRDSHGDPHEAFPVPPGYTPGFGVNEHRVWGGSIVADPANHRMLGIYHLVKHLGSGEQSVGYGLAVWTEASNAWAPVAITNPPDPTQPYLLWPSSTTSTLPVFNTGMLLKDGFLYAYGCYAADFRCNLARVSVTTTSAVADRAAWRFFTAGGGTGCPAGTWSADVTCAQPLPSDELDFFGNPGVPLGGGGAGMSVFWNPYLSNYMAVYSAPGSNDLLYRVAYTPEGPWSAPGLIAQGMQGAPTTTGSPSVNYAGYAHPELAEQNGKVQYVTYVRNLGFPSSEFDLVRVQFGTAPSSYQRKATAESYFADSGGTLRINAAGPTRLGPAASATPPSATLADDRGGVVYQRGTLRAGGSAVVELETQSSTSSSAVAGIVVRNSIVWAHNDLLTGAGVGYVTLGSSPGGGGVALRWDSDGDQDLDQQLPASPASVSGAVWLKLTRTIANQYTGAYSTAGATGPWTTVGSATLSNPGNVPAAQQDVGLLATGPDATTTNRAVFSGFEVRPGWVSTWGAAVQPVPSGGAYQSGLDNRTVRNIVHTSISGSRVRVRVSNLDTASGAVPLPVGAASVGLPSSPGSASLTASTVTPLTFDGGATTVTVPVGAEIYSDPVTITLPAGETLQDRDLAVSLYLSGPTGTPTWHRVSLQDTYVVGGNHALDAAGTAFTDPGNPNPKTPSWYYVSAVDVEDDQALGTVVPFGDSLTDGNPFLPGFRNWPEKLVDRLVAAPPVRLAVANGGIAGSTLAGGPPRLAADALARTGVRTVVVELGVNDFNTSSTPTAAQLVGYLRAITNQGRASGVRVLVGTITPTAWMSDNFPNTEPVRQAVNAYLRTSTEFDGVVDFDAAIRDDTVTPTDPADFSEIDEAFSAGANSVHVNEAGNVELAATVVLGTLYQPPRTR